MDEGSCVIKGALVLNFISMGSLDGLSTLIPHSRFMCRNLIPLSAGISVRLDGTPMRHYRIGIGPVTSEVVCRKLTAIQHDGSRKNLSATLARCSSKSPCL